MLPSSSLLALRRALLQDRHPLHRGLRGRGRLLLNRIGFTEPALSSPDAHGQSSEQEERQLRAFLHCAQGPSPSLPTLAPPARRAR